ncbi:hypothetical protein D3C78_1911300 [compost metagenome]
MDSGIRAPRTGQPERFQGLAGDPDEGLFDRSLDRSVPGLTLEAGEVGSVVRNL